MADGKSLISKLGVLAYCYSLLTIGAVFIVARAVKDFGNGEK
jgi:hypothetical protein